MSPFSRFSRRPLEFSSLRSLLRLWALAAAAAYFLPASWVFALVALYLSRRLWLNVRTLQNLALWLERPEGRMPDGEGAWSEVLASWYALHRRETQSAEQLAAGMNRFRDIMAQLPDAVALLDENTVIEWLNPAAETCFDLNLSRDGGLRFVHSVRLPELSEALLARRFDRPLNLKTNGRFLEVRLFAFAGRRIILTAHDLSESRRAENMRRDFVANASHELRTPLTVIVGFLEQWEDNPELDPELRRQTAAVRRQSRRMEAVIGDMLTLSRLDSEDAPEIPEAETDMPCLLARASDNARALSAGRHRFDSFIENIPLRVKTSDLEIALDNLLSNAVHYSGEDSDITLSWQCRDGRPTLTVSDNGRGVAPEHLPRLCERFYRPPGQERRGTGLGLAIVQSIARRYGAELRIVSRPAPDHEQGMSVSLIFPAVEKV